MMKDHSVAPDQDLCRRQRHCTRYFTAIAKSERRAGMLGRDGRLWSIPQFTNRALSAA
jgi:hypothetical protein